MLNYHLHIHRIDQKMSISRYIKGFKNYLLLERQLSENTIVSYLKDIKKLDAKEKEQDLDVAKMKDLISRMEMVILKLD